jgi:hypothetical protein
MFHVKHFRLKGETAALSDVAPVLETTGGVASQTPPGPGDDFGGLLSRRKWSIETQVGRYASNNLT